MKKTFRKYFIPHAGNNFHPHILHAKRAWFYGALGFLIKGFVVAFVVLLPAEAFVMPNIIAVEESKMVMLTNALRVKYGLPKLAENPKLALSANYKAEDMAEKQYFAHENPEGKRLAYFLEKAGYNYDAAGENLAIGYYDAVEVINAWKASPTHKANMLDKDFTQIGIGSKDGAYENSATLYVAQHFGNPIAGEAPDASDPLFSDAKDESAAGAILEKTNEFPAVVGSTAQSTGGSNHSIAHKYFSASRVLGDIMPLFSYSKMLYLSFIIFFALSFLLNVLVEFKVQHKHVIIRTLSLLGILAGLWLI